jgi:uridylate kinase
MVSYRRILLKLSGEALSTSDQNIDSEMLKKVVCIVQAALDLGVEIAIVVGGGNIYRGSTLSEKGMNKITGDHIGMLATVMNALALSDAFERNKIPSTVMSGFPIGGGVCESFNHTKAKTELTNGKVVIFSAGTGSPCFTTDTAAALRAVEIGAEIVFKATKVDGIYSSDPIIDSSAIKFDSLTFDSAIEQNIKVMDTAAFALCRDNNIKICVFSMLEDNYSLANIIKGQAIGTTVSQNGE